MEDSSRRYCKELPEECWELILSRLAINDDYSSLRSPSMVCKQFLSVTDGLRRELLACSELFFRNRCEVLCRALKRFQNLEDIQLSDRGDINCAVSKIISSGLDLQFLGFYSMPISPCTESFRRLGSTMNNLKKFLMVKSARKKTS